MTKSDIDTILNGSEDSPKSASEFLLKLVEYAEAEQHVLILKPSEIKQIKSYITKLELVTDVAIRRDKKIKEWRENLSAVPNDKFSIQLFASSQELGRLDDELERVLKELEDSK
jgi:hypothetical protein